MKSLGVFFIAVLMLEPVWGHDGTLPQGPTSSPPTIKTRCLNMVREVGKLVSFPNETWRYVNRHKSREARNQVTFARDITDKSAEEAFKTFYEWIHDYENYPSNQKALEQARQQKLHRIQTLTQYLNNTATEFPLKVTSMKPSFSTEPGGRIKVVPTDTIGNVLYIRSRRQLEQEIRKEQRGLQELIKKQKWLPISQTLHYVNFKKTLGLLDVNHELDLIDQVREALAKFDVASKQTNTDIRADLPISALVELLREVERQKTPLLGETTDAIEKTTTEFLQTLKAIKEAEDPRKPALKVLLKALEKEGTKPSPEEIQRIEAALNVSVSYWAAALQQGFVSFSRVGSKIDSVIMTIKKAVEKVHAPISVVHMSITVGLAVAFLWSSIHLENPEKKRRREIKEDLTSLVLSSDDNELFLKNYKALGKKWYADESVLSLHQVIEDIIDGIIKVDDDGILVNDRGLTPYQMQMAQEFYDLGYQAIYGGNGPFGPIPVYPLEKRVEIRTKINELNNRIIEKVKKAGSLNAIFPKRRSHQGSASNAIGPVVSPIQTAPGSGSLGSNASAPTLSIPNATNQNLVGPILSIP